MFNVYVCLCYANPWISEVSGDGPFVYGLSLLVKETKQGVTTLPI